MRTAAILPVKRFDLAKQRLSATLAEPFRLELVRAMVGDVLVALHATQELAGTVVVTSEPGVVVAARYQDALVVDDRAHDGQSAAALLGVERAMQEGYERVLLIPGDCPALDSDELAELLFSSRAKPQVVIVPDRHGTGTNGLLLTPPDVIAPSFGPASCARHSALAGAVGAAPRLVHTPSLMLDVDTVEDLEALRERLPDGTHRAARTRAVLDRLAPVLPAT